MTDLCVFSVTRKWPAQHPKRLQRYSRPTPNGVKVSVMRDTCTIADIATFVENFQNGPDLIASPIGATGASD